MEKNQGDEFFRKFGFFKIFKIKSKKYIPSKLKSNQLSIPGTESGFITIIYSDVSKKNMTKHLKILAL